DPDGVTPAGGGRCHDSRDQPPPLRPDLARIATAVRGDVDDPVVLLRGHPYAPVLCRTGRHDDLPVDRHRQDEALVVIRVVAHQVHTAGSAEDTGHGESVLTRRAAVMLHTMSEHNFE